MDLNAHSVFRIESTGGKAVLQARTDSVVDLDALIAVPVFIPCCGHGRAPFTSFAKYA